MSEPIELIDNYLNGTIADSDAEVLRRWLDADEQHLAEFLRSACIHRALRNSFAGEQDARAYTSPNGSSSSEANDRADEGLPSLRDEAVARGSLRSLVSPALRLIRRPTPLSWAVATVVMAVVVTAMSFMVPPFYRAMTRGTDAENKAYEIVAQLTAVDAPKWSARRPSSLTGAHLVTGRELELESGLAEVTFRGGAVVVLQGPCKFTVDEPNAGSLAAGHLIARVNQQARGFRVLTPTADIVDLGTEFGVSAHPDGTTAIAVLRGTVSVDARKTPAAGSRVVIGKGEAVEVRRIGGDVQVTRLQGEASQRLVKSLPPALSAPGVNVVRNGNFEFVQAAPPRGKSYRHTGNDADVPHWATSTRGHFFVSDPHVIFNYSHSYLQIQTPGTGDLYQVVTLPANDGVVLRVAAAHRNDNVNTNGRVFLELYRGTVTAFADAAPLVPAATRTQPLRASPQTYWHNYGPLPAGDYTVRVGGTASSGAFQAGISRVQLLTEIDGVSGEAEAPPDKTKAIAEP
jgi:hypothetical protein